MKLFPILCLPTALFPKSWYPQAYRRAKVGQKVWFFPASGSEEASEEQGKEQEF